MPQLLYACLIKVVYCAHMHKEKVKLVLRNWNRYYSYSVIPQSFYYTQAMENDTILLPNGHVMPIVGFGTWQVNLL